MRSLVVGVGVGVGDAFGKGDSERKRGFYFFLECCVVLRSG